MPETKDFSAPVSALLQRGVVIHRPATVEVEPEIQPERIAPGAVIHGGCRLRGAETSIGPESVIGEEAPATVENCQLGTGVHLKGGYFSSATFLDGVSLGSAAHVRVGTLLEEQSGGAHAVGFKHTILFPYVTAGSLINFCDALMAGGTSRRNHSEIGSSYIHFNFTPHQDKATASLVGDVPRGVMLDQPPIFLGGQGGLVGPARIAFGCVIPAGVVYRHDALEEGRLLLGGSGPTRKAALPYRAEAFGAMDRIVINNLHYLGNLRALQEWYRHVRVRYARAEAMAAAVQQGARQKLEWAVEERIRRLADLAGLMPRSMEARGRPGAAADAAAAAQQGKLANRWPWLSDQLRRPPAESLGAKSRQAFLDGLDREPAGKAYLESVAALSPALKQHGTAWLQAVVDSVVSIWHHAATDKKLKS